MQDKIDLLISELLKEQNLTASCDIPVELVAKRRQLRSLMNRRPPIPASAELLKLQDQELLKQSAEKGIIEADQISSSELHPRIKLWQGDITRLKVDAIVNAANSQMLGCFVPLHGCIDNAIHSASGIQLRLECHELMKVQNHPEPTGSAKITRGYNLPSKFVIHTVGPIVYNGILTKKEEDQLSGCYSSCLQLANEKKLKSIAFCCISTGEYHFPNRKAAEIALFTVKDFFSRNPDTTIETVIFNVFKEPDLSIYKQLSR